MCEQPVRDTPNTPRVHREYIVPAAKPQQQQLGPSQAEEPGDGDSRNGNTDDEDPSGFDARFPNQNQTKHCWQNYVDYHKCILAKGEDFKPCRQVRLGSHPHPLLPNPTYPPVRKQAQRPIHWLTHFALTSQFFLAYRSLCPSSWCERWDDQRENGTFPARLDQ